MKPRPFAASSLAVRRTRASSAALLALLALLASVGCERKRVAQEVERDAMAPSADVAADGGRAAQVARDSDRPTVRCAADPIAFPIRFDAVDALDVLFVIDDSPSMAPVQEQLTFLFPQLLGNVTQVVTDSSVRSIHLAVASGDLGLLGADGVEGCTQLGKDAQLRHDPPPALDCARALPAFLAFTPERDDAFAANAELACMTELGTAGCGLQQPLEVALRALWPARDGRVSIAGGEQRAHGDTSNAGFLRDPAQERSVLALIVVTNKDDCSLADAEAFVADAGLATLTGAQLNERLNARCAEDPSRLHDLARYVEAFELLRPAPDRLLVFAAIAGVPRVTNARLSDVDAEDSSAIDEFYTRLLAEPDMQLHVDDHDTPERDDDTLGLACEGSQGPAWPARRLVELAHSFGPRGVVGSLCEDDFGDTVRALAARAHRLLGDACLAAPLQRDAGGLVACELIWTLPERAVALPGTPSECSSSELPFLLPAASAPERAPAGGTRCRLPQLRVGTHEGGLAALATEREGQTFEQGWYYDDFSGETGRQCRQQPRRIALTAGVRPPPPDVRVALECPSAAFGGSANMGCELLAPDAERMPPVPSEEP